MRIENNSSMKQSINQNQYKKYEQQKIPSKYNKQNLMMFLSVFAVLLLIFLGLARIMSPDIDISLSDDSAQIELDDTYSQSVDSRLKLLQQDDEMNLLEHDIDDSVIEEDGVVNIPKFSEKTVINSDDNESDNTEVEKADENLKNENKQLNRASDSNRESEIPSIRQNNTIGTTAPTVPALQVIKTYRVYVGMYATQAQAEVAKGILLEAGLGVSPAVKQAAGGYTLQVGAFNSKESATNLTNKLLMNNYPARVVSD